MTVVKNSLLENVTDLSQKRVGKYDDVNSVQTTWPFWAPRYISQVITFYSN